MKKLFTLLLAAAASIGMSLAYDMQVGNLYYLDYDGNGIAVEVVGHTQDLSGDVVIPSSVTYDGRVYRVVSIGESAFSYCSSLTSVTIPNSVTSIGKEAFYDCRALNTVEIPNSVTSIGEGAFSYCEGMTGELIIPNSVTSIGNEAFSCCNGLSSITISNSITNIESGVFGYCHGLSSITIPNSVTSIGYGAFQGCSGLTSVTIPNSVTSIESYAFEFCENLQKVNITDIEAWCNIFFNSSSCNPLATAHHLYMNNTEVTELVIPNSVTSIGNYAFSGCSSLTSVTIGNNVISIGNDAFDGCSGITSVTIPNSVTSIGNNAFYYCTGLTSVTIPNSVTSIGSSAFACCYGLTSVTNFANTPQEIGSYVFDNIDKSTCVLYVPAGSVSAYKSADQWKDFSNILPIEAQPADVTTTTVTPFETTADIAWPQVTGAATYTIEIKKNGELICTLTFNAQGQLISIAFNAPSRNNAPQQSQAAGFSFTITGLESGTTYSYTMKAKGNNGNVLKTESGTFTTTGESQGIDQVPSDQVQSTKLIKNGQILILRGDKSYTLQGAEVK